MRKVYLERCVLRDLAWQWSNTPRWLFIVEILGVCAWLGLSIVYLWSDSHSSDLLPLDSSALNVQQGNERWNGIFFEDQHVGFTVNRTSSLEDGRMLLEQRTMLKLVTFEKLQTLFAETQGYYESFLDSNNLYKAGKISDKELNT